MGHQYLKGKVLLKFVFLFFSTSMKRGFYIFKFRSNDRKNYECIDLFDAMHKVAGSSPFDPKYNNPIYRNVS